MTFYALLVATSGEDTSLNYTPYPEVLGVFENKKRSRKNDER